MTIVSIAPSRFVASRIRGELRDLHFLHYFFQENGTLKGFASAK